MTKAKQLRKQAMKDAAMSSSRETKAGKKMFTGVNVQNGQMVSFNAEDLRAAMSSSDEAGAASSVRISLQDMLRSQHAETFINDIDHYEELNKYHDAKADENAANMFTRLTREQVFKPTGKPLEPLKLGQLARVKEYLSDDSRLPFLKDVGNLTVMDQRVLQFEIASRTKASDILLDLVAVRFGRPAALRARKFIDTEPPTPINWGRFGQMMTPRGCREFFVAQHVSRTIDLLNSGDRVLEHFFATVQVEPLPFLDKSQVLRPAKEEGQDAAEGRRATTVLEDTDVVVLSKD